jgi:class 3 adenylate cyclase
MSNNHDSGEFPSGIVTFLFTDIQDSTRLWERYPEAMAAALAQHDQLIVDTVRSNDGVVVKSTGKVDKAKQHAELARELWNNVGGY